jgi:integrase/recombinase XerD
MKINAKNERIKKQYFEFLKEAKKHSDSTIDNIRKALFRWEEFTKYKDFGLSKQGAISFKKHLAGVKAKQSGDALSLSTMNSTINILKEFFKWLAYQNGYKKKINIFHVEYLSLSENETRAAKSTGFRAYPTIEQIHKVLEKMPYGTEVEKRNRALIAFLLLTGIRDGAIASLKLKHVDLEHCLVKQDPREVKTKFRKRIDTFFFPVGDMAGNIVMEWFKYLKEEKLYGINDPLFPRTKLEQNKNNGFTAGGLEPIHWNSASQIREVFKIAFELAGLPYFNPHSFRKTIVNLGEKLCKNPEEFKAWSQNLGHESPLTTFTSYGYVDVNRQGDIIRSIGKDHKEDSLKQILEQLQKMQSVSGSPAI